MRTTTSALRAALAVAALLLAGVLAGCGGDGSGGTAQPGGNVSSSPAPGSSPAPPPSGPVSVPPATASKYPSGELTLTGTPEEGVESGCVVMRSGGTLYLLLGGDRAILQSGRTVIVRGRATPGMITTCQQGTPFEVTEVRAA